MCGNKTHHGRNKKWYPSNAGSVTVVRKKTQTPSPKQRRKKKKARHVIYPCPAEQPSPALLSPNPAPFSRRSDLGPTHQSSTSALPPQSHKNTNCRLSMPSIPPSDGKRSVHERLNYFGGSSLVMEGGLCQCLCWVVTHHLKLVMRGRFGRGSCGRHKVQGRCWEVGRPSRTKLTPSSLCLLCSPGLAWPWRTTAVAISGSYGCGKTL